jgi:3-oxoacyl-[acyl-carrier protein] reductase
MGVAAFQTRAMDTPLRRRGPRVAIVTGGSRGIGRAVVGVLASRGYAVVVDYLHDRRCAESTVQTLLAGNASAVAVRADVADELDVERLFAETLEAFGGVDVVVHAVRGRAGAAPVAEADLVEFEALCRINTRGTFLVNREAARRLRDGGSIVNLTSSTVDTAAPSHGVDATTSAAAVALTRVLALELRERDITVNAVSLDVHLPCAPDRIAEVVMSLLGNGRGSTGQVVPVAGPG